jgi:hypothetical protein
VSSTAENTPQGVRIAREPIYHYTDASGLLGIVQERKLWASEAAGLNDRAEVRQGWAKILEWAERQPGSEAMELILDHSRHPAKESHEVFILSASTRPDDANQWRLYAGGGRGYTVELDPSVPLVVASDAVRRWRRSETSLGSPDWDFDLAATSAYVTPWFHVLYNDQEIDTALRFLKKRVESDIAQLEDMKARAVDDDRIGEEAADSFDRSYGFVAQLANLIKEPGFAGENEVRIVTTFLRAEDHLRYRAGAYGVVGYAELITSPTGEREPVIVDGDDPAPLPIKSVRIGPLLGLEHERTVSAMLRKFDQSNDVAVHLSEVPLR